MSAVVAPYIARALSSDLGVPVATFEALPAWLRDRVRIDLERQTTVVEAVTVRNQRYLVASYGGLENTRLVLGPYIMPSDAANGDAVVLDAAAEREAQRSLKRAATDLRAIAEEPRHRLELAHQLEALSNAVLAITSELDLDVVLQRIVDIAREVVNARYAAVGVPTQGNEYKLQSFITSGLSSEEEERIGDLPHGHGVLGVLLSEQQPLRLPDLTTHPNSAGFPPNHPPMRSFLGAPIMLGGRLLGSIYLTEKRFASEFDADDARLLEMVARHAAVAIENASLYRDIERQEQWLGLIIDQFPEAIIIHEPEPEPRTLLNRHAAELLGWPPDNRSRFGPLDEWDVTAFHPDGTVMPVAAWPIARAISQSEVTSQDEILLERADGRRFTALVNCSPLRDASGKPVAAVVGFQDITAIKDADQIKDDFLSLISHELRTPLTTIQGGARLLTRMDRQIDEDSRLLLLTDIYRESIRLSNLIENLVQVAHVRSGRVELETEPIHLHLQIEQAIDIFRVANVDRTFTVDVDPGSIVEADPNCLDEILRNLVDNAIKYTPAGTPVVISSQRNHDLIEIAVRDYGDGIPDEDIPRLFDRFQRGTRAGSASGMGIGLYLCRELVEINGGSIRVETVADGACFVFSLPAVADV